MTDYLIRPCTKCGRTVKMVITDPKFKSPECLCPRCDKQPEPMRMSEGYNK